MFIKHYMTLYINMLKEVGDD